MLAVHGQRAHRRVKSPGASQLTVVEGDGGHQEAPSPGKLGEVAGGLASAHLCVGGQGAGGGGGNDPSLACSFRVNLHMPDSHVQPCLNLKGCVAAR